jgi:hypothetical protein
MRAKSETEFFIEVRALRGTCVQQACHKVGREEGDASFLEGVYSQIPHFDMQYNYSDKFYIVSKLFTLILAMKISSSVRKLTYLGVLSATLFMDEVLTKAEVPLYLR